MHSRMPATRMLTTRPIVMRVEKITHYLSYLPAIVSNPAARSLKVNKKMFSLLTRVSFYGRNERFG